MTRDERRDAYHKARVNKADSAQGRLNRACQWLIARAIRHHRIGDVMICVLDLVYRLREGIALPEPAPGSTARTLYEALEKGTASTDRRHEA